ncbi:MAG: glutamine synthetase III, partial [Firmicutes bacterium]|nr:glutamine synthetase III [Bacillota bacterium]
MKNDELTVNFAENVFDDKKMRRYLPRATYKAIRDARERNAPLTQKHLDIFAKALKKWARSKGALRYTHWFQPLNDFTAEKRDSLTSLNREGNAVFKFRGKELTKGEGDASSLPNGGMRETFEARGITQWDCTSDVFIKGDCLYIPTTFRSFNGEALDKKTPLLKSCKALNKQALRVLELLGFSCLEVRCVVGAEQEYFLIDSDLFDKRKDLVYTGRTLFGAMPPKGQEFYDHYFSPPTDKVLRFMRKVDKELWKLGIIVKTE